LKTKTLLYPAIGSFLLGVFLCVLMLLQPVTLEADGKKTVLSSGGLTAGAVLKNQGYTAQPGDEVHPPVWLPLIFTRQVSLTTSAEVDVFNDGQLTTFASIERRPLNLLLEAGIPIFPFDSLVADGQPANIDSLLSPAERHTLQYRQAMPLHFSDGNISIDFYSSAGTVGAALWEQGISPEPGDALDPPFNTPLDGPIAISLRHGRELTIIDGGVTRTVRSSATTVGGVLLDVGLSPQGLDYCRPQEDQPVPLDGVIRLVRVREEIQLNQTPIPNTIQYQPDANTELDQQVILDPGAYGLSVLQVKVRYEDGKEVSRQTETEWQATAARPQIIGYGTKVVIRTVEVDGRTIEYWRSVTVYATSYSPCNSGVPECLGTTANGMKVEKGVVGVIRSWYNLLNGQYIYAPGYGSAVIADIGAGFAGKDWIDLGYSDSDYVPWHSNITIYFLTPVPANIPWILP
jgi:uncharacterized protein YabE (DUF348 family)